MFTRFKFGALHRAAVLCTLLLLGAASAYAENKAITPVSRPDAGWQKRQASFNERVKQGNVDLLFIGDSITQGWEGAGKDA